jgi:cyclopropane fatty-acyl-phospholipid synthase-like methyltransferase
MIKEKMFNRRAKKNSKQVLNKLKLNKEMIVADIGSGGGFYSYKFAGKVKKVYSLDINKDFLEFINKESRKRNLRNIETLYIKDKIKIPEEVDLIFIRNVYHHLEDRTSYFKNLKKYLNKDGRLVIVEWKKSFIGHGTDKEKILKELKEAGFGMIKDYKIPKQSFLIFKK